MKKHIVWAMLLVVTVILLLALWPGTVDDKQQRLQLAIGFGLAILLFLFGFVILLGIASGEIVIDTILSESGGGASMSRFQLLIFTFVIALSLFFIVANNPKQFPSVPTDILTLLGISATTYGVSKGIQAANPDMKPKEGDGGGTTTVTTTTQTTPPPATTTTTQQTTP
jgi:uncharacterized membrane protein